MQASPLLQHQSVLLAVLVGHCLLVEIFKQYTHHLRLVQFDFVVVLENLAYLYAQL